MSDQQPLMLTSPKKLEFEDKVSESVKLIQRQIRNKKWAIIKERLKAIEMLHVLKDIKSKRFKPLIIEEDKTGTQTVYVDNGTWGGLRLVTFLPEEEHEMKDNEFKGHLKYF